MARRRRAAQGDARAPEGSVSSGDAATCLSDGTAGAPCERPRPQEDVLPDFNACLDAYPRCQGLVNAFRLNRNTQNKTPLSIVHEYATRLGLEVRLDQSLWTASRSGKLRDQQVPVLSKRVNSVWCAADVRGERGEPAGAFHGGGQADVCRRRRAVRLWQRAGERVLLGCQPVCCCSPCVLAHTGVRVFAGPRQEGCQAGGGRGAAGVVAEPGRPDGGRLPAARQGQAAEGCPGEAPMPLCYSTLSALARVRHAAACRRAQQPTACAQAKAQRRWQSGRARLADCKAHVLPSYSASGLQFIGDSMCRANALFEPHLGALAASDALAANAVSGFSDAQHSLLGSSFYTGGALTTSEPGVAAGGLPLADFDTSAKLVRGRARMFQTCPAPAGS